MSIDLGFHKTGTFVRINKPSNVAGFFMTKLCSCHLQISSLLIRLHARVNMFVRLFERELSVKSLRAVPLAQL